MTAVLAVGYTGSVAAGYHGPPELTPVRAFTEWALDPWALAVLLVAGLLLDELGEPLLQAAVAAVSASRAAPAA